MKNSGMQGQGNGESPELRVHQRTKLGSGRGLPRKLRRRALKGRYSKPGVCGHRADGRAFLYEGSERTEKGPGCRGK